MIDFKTGLIICCAAALTACGSKDVKAPEAPTVAGAPKAPDARSMSKDMSGYSYDISKYSGIEVGEPMDVAIKKIRKHLTPEGEGEGNMSVTWGTQDAGKGLQTFSGLVTNMADDSVKAQEIKAVFKKNDGEYWVVEHGGRVKCWRGDNPDKWTTKLCP